MSGLFIAILVIYGGMVAYEIIVEIAAEIERILYKRGEKK